MKRDPFSYLSVAVLVALLAFGCRNGDSEDSEGAPSEAGIQINSVEPEFPEIGVPITISGQGFGNRQDHTVSIGGNGISVNLEVVEWQDDRIVATIPDDPRIQHQSYYYQVQSTDYQERSNLFQFSFR